MSTATLPAAAVRKSTDAKLFLSMLHQPGDVFEVRIPKCPIFKGATKRMTVSGYFNNPADAARAALHADSRFCPTGVYVTLGPCKPDLLARACNRLKENAESTTQDDQIVSRRWLLLDIDSVREANISASGDEVCAAISLASELRYELAREGWPEPIRVMSGNGGYLIYPIELPNDEQSTELVKSVLHSLARRFDTAAAKVDCSTFNASRILKIPGTTARKGDSIPSRPHRVAYFSYGEEPAE